MDLSRPISDVIPGAHGIVLSVLASTSEPLTGRRVAELGAGDVSQSSVSRILRELVRAGIVACQPAGRANLYSLNLEHLAAPSVVQLTGLRQALLDRLALAVAAWDLRPLAVWMFGSAARGAGTPESDIDLFVLRPDAIDDDDAWSAQTGALAEAVTRWTGNACDLLDYGETEFTDLVAAGDPIAASLRDDAIVVYGTNPRDLIGRVRR